MASAFCQYNEHSGWLILHNSDFKIYDGDVDEKHHLNQC